MKTVNTLLMLVAIVAPGEALPIYAVHFVAIAMPQGARLGSVIVLIAAVAVEVPLPFEDCAIGASGTQNVDLAAIFREKASMQAPVDRWWSQHVLGTRIGWKDQRL